MARYDLSDRFVKTVKPKEERVDYFDADAPTSGLALRVSPSGAKAWSLHFTTHDGRRARVTLGSYPATSLAGARARALEAKAALEDGQDPRALFSEQAAAAMTVAALVESYLEKHVRSNLRTAAEVERRFSRNVIPIIGGLKVADLHKRDVNRVIDPILRRKSPTEASHAFEDMRALLRWAVARGDLDHNPMAGMQRPAASQTRERVLSDVEMASWWNGLPKSLARSKALQRILKLCLVTAQRVGEVSGMALAELDLEKAIWTIPAARAKNGFSHTVPLSPLAVELITEAIEAAGKRPKWVFPNDAGDGPLPAAAVGRAIARGHETSIERPKGRFGIDHWTAHDLRRTAVSGMAALGIAPIVLGHVINHRSVTKAGVTLAVYARYDYAKEKREALELWAERLAAVISGGAGQVLQLRASK